MVSGGLKYDPYGAEFTVTANDRDKFGTYYRDSNTGFNYADQRHYGSSGGRFLTPDPAEAGTIDYPDSLNLNSYVQNDPINFNDPEGLLKCGDLIVSGTGGTLRSVLSGPGEEVLFAQVVWAESDPRITMLLTANYFLEREAIAMSILNSRGILSGTIRIEGVPNPAVLGWGPLNATISQMLGQPNQNATVTGGPSGARLAGTFQDRLDSVLNQDQAGGSLVIPGPAGPVSMTPECVNLWQSWLVASQALAGLVRDPFSQHGVTTGFHHGFRVGQIEPYFGSFGTANNFFGIRRELVSSGRPFGPVAPNPRQRQPVPRQPGPRR